MIGGVVNAHVAVKFIYVRVFRGTNSMHSQSLMARLVWAAICAGLWILSWIIAEGIPVFNDVLGLAVCTTYPDPDLGPDPDSNLKRILINYIRAHYLLVGFHSVYLGYFGSI